MKDDEIKQNLKDCLGGKISFNEMYEFIMWNFWDAENDLASSIKLRFFEYTSGHWTKQELREKLGKFLNE